MSRYVATPPLTALELAALIKAANRGSPLPIAREARAVERALTKLEAGHPFPALPGSAALWGEW